MVKESSQYIGKPGLYQIHSMGFPVTICDVRRVFNRVDFEIEPIKGTGKSWVDAQTVKVLIEQAGQLGAGFIRRIEV